MKDGHDDFIKPKEKVPAASTKRPSKKKPKDKPKRPLSAYNFFFKEEREKILKIVTADEGEKVENDPNSDDYLDEETLSRLRKDGGKVSFEEMGKIIGQRWKNIDPDRLSKYSELANEDTERYKKEMTDYNGKQEAKMRSEALKPPAAYPATSSMPSKGAPSSAVGYDPMQMNPAAYGNAAGMQGAYYGGGMDFSAYQGMYGPYGGYGGMGGQEGMGQFAGQGMDPSQYGRGGGQGGSAAMYGMQGGVGGYQGGMGGYG